jgi:multidrug efflux pump subunit AcrA (membrane-fusion protein)
MIDMDRERRARRIVHLLAIVVAGGCSDPPPPAPAPRPTPPAPAPAPPSAALADIPGPITVVTAGRAGVIAEIVDDHGKLAAGDVLARFTAPLAITGPQLDAYAVRAPAAGTVRTKVATGDTVAAGTPLATIQAPSTLVARFRLPAGHGHALGAQLRVTPRAAPGSKHLTCKVSEADGASIALTCPNNAGIPNGVEVIIQ